MKVSDAIAKAKKTLDETLTRLHDRGYEKIAEILERLSAMALFLFARAHDRNVVHHNFIVLSNMAEIMLGEGVSDEGELLCGLTAALLHDIGFAETEEGRIRSADIKQTPPEQREAIIEKAIESRQAHMQAGAEITALLLETYNSWFGKTFSDDQIRSITRSVSIHDNSSIQEYETLRVKPSGKVWLFDADDTQIKYLRSADRLFMLNPDGIEVDLERDRQKTGHADPLTRIQGNIKRHREEAELYQKALGEEAKAYGFIDGFLYRDPTSYEIFKRFISALEEKYQIQISLDV